VRFFVGITDRDWFDFLSRMDGLDEVNFWQPRWQQQFHALQIAEPFLFKLHSPDDYIVGGGFFSHFTILPASIVWQAFGEKNGARTEEEMRTRIARYRRTRNPGTAGDYQIGCILLTNSRRGWCSENGTPWEVYSDALTCAGASIPAHKSMVLNSSRPHAFR
jgi:putative restriction endonuclease